MSFGDNLKNILDEKGISQKTFAEMINIAPTTLNGYANGKREPSLAILCRISSVLGISTDYLLGCNNKNVSLSYSEMNLINCFRNMSESRKKVLLQLSHELSDSNEKE